jgi:hypothetical protein
LHPNRYLLIVDKENHMKKFLALSVALSLVSVQAFAQTAQTQDASSAPAPAAAAPAATGPLATLSAKTGLSTPALVAIGVSIAAVAAVVADNNDDATTTHHTTSHHGR